VVDPTGVGRVRSCAELGAERACVPLTPAGSSPDSSVSSGMSDEPLAKSAADDGYVAKVREGKHKVYTN
jgi:hypothetical protein